MNVVITRTVACALLAGLAGVLGACGEEQPTAATVTVVERVVERTVTAPPPPSAEAAVAPNPPPPPARVSPASAKIVVPNVVGKDHQLAQDTMQAAGLYLLDEVDATGQGRALIIDRNWTVVSQSPKAGSRVSDDTTITLRSKKDNE